MGRKYPVMISNISIRTFEVENNLRVTQKFILFDYLNYGRDGEFFDAKTGAIASKNVSGRNHISFYIWQ